MYDVVEESFLIIPNTTGTIRVPAIVLEATIPNTFWQLGTRVKYFSTEAKLLKVKSIPNDISINDWFPAADVQISDNWSTDKNIKEGELLTRTVKIKAKGVLSNDIPKLEFKSFNNFNVYPEKPELQDIEQAGQLTGVVTYKIGYMPVKQGKAIIPAIKLKWFDVDNHKSKVASIDTKTFDVQKGNIPNSSFVANGQPLSSQVIQKIVKDTFWRNVAIGLFILWFITFILLIKCKVTKKITTEAGEKQAELHQKVTGLKEMKKACTNKYNIQLQRAIIGWANTQVDKQIFSLLEVAEVFPHLKDILKELNAVIYATKDFNHYHELLNLIRNTTKSAKTKSDNLVKGDYEKILLSILLLAFVVTANSQTVLITGFALFGGEKINPSWQVVKQIPDNIDGAKIIKKQLPVSFKGSVDRLDSLIKEYNPGCDYCCWRSRWSSGNIY